MTAATVADAALVGALDRIAGSMGETQIVRLDHPRLDLYAKLEYTNPFGSSKDRSCYWILRRAIERGEIVPGSTVVESSSGNFAISMASFCRALGVRFIPVIDPNCASATESYLRLACERVERVVELDHSGGFLQTRLARVHQICAEVPNSYWPNQYGNADAVEAHYELTGGELCRSLERLDYLFVGVSTGGTIGGLSRRVKQEFPGVQVVAVDAEGSAIFGAAPKRRRIPGIGSSICPDLMQQAQIDDVVIVPETATVRACHRLLRNHGLYVGGSTGSVFAAIESYFGRFTRRTAGRRPSVAFLAADRGTAYADTIYDAEWVARLDAESPRTPAEPGHAVVLSGWARDAARRSARVLPLRRRRSAASHSKLAALPATPR